MGADPSRVWLVCIAWLVAAIPDSLYTVAITSALYTVVPVGKSRPAFFAVASLLTLVFYGVGAYLAVHALKIIKELTLDLGFIVLGQFQLLYLWSAILMPITLFAAWLLPGRGGSSDRTLTTPTHTAPKPDPDHA